MVMDPKEVKRLNDELMRQAMQEARMLDNTMSAVSRVPTSLKDVVVYEGSQIQGSIEQIEEVLVDPSESTLFSGSQLLFESGKEMDRLDTSTLSDEKMSTMGTTVYSRFSAFPLGQTVVGDRFGGEYETTNRPLGVFSKILREARKHTDNLSELFEVLVDDFFNTNKDLIFSQYSESDTPQFAALSNKYVQKYRNGEAWPILVLSGNLRSSLTDRKDSMAYVRIGNKSFDVGTDVPYASMHQLGTEQVPSRPPVQFDVGNRKDKWETYALRYLSGLYKDAA